MTDYVSARGAVVAEAGGPVEITAIEVARPVGDQVMIGVDACGLCHSDLHYIDGSSGQDFPYLVGHEVAGRVLEVGDAVRGVEVGQRVMVALMAPCGDCDQCSRGHATRCARKLIEAPLPRLPSGDTLTPVLGVGGLADKVTIDERHVVPIPDHLPVDVAALLGCGVPTGYGAAVNTGGVTAGCSVAVIGCGGVGLAAIAGARHRGAARIAAVDVQRVKLDEAKHFGATETYRVGEETLPTGFDLVIDAVGGARTLATAFDLAGVGGRVVMAGAPYAGEVGELALRPIFLKRNELAVSHWGDCEPVRDVAALVAMYDDGSLPLDRYVSERVSLEEAHAAYGRLERGEVLRSVVIVDEGTAG